MSKKTKFMRVGAALMVLALGTSCFVGGTLAKYTTEGKASDSARVAKFGVEIKASSDDTFKTSYTTDDSAVKGTISTSVVSSTDMAVIAPGTKGTLAAFTITGKPEVAVNVKYKVESLTFSGNWYDTYNSETKGYSGDGYYPIIFTVATTTKATGSAAETTKSEYFYVGKDDIETTADIADAINTYLTNTANANYKANTDLGSTEEAPEVTISWEWPFEASKVPSEIVTAWEKIQTDKKDTVLGDYAASISKDGSLTTEEGGIVTKSTDMPTITVKSSATVTQID